MASYNFNVPPSLIHHNSNQYLPSPPFVPREEELPKTSSLVSQVVGQHHYFDVNLLPGNSPEPMPLVRTESSEIRDLAAALKEEASRAVRQDSPPLSDCNLMSSSASDEPESIQQMVDRPYACEVHQCGKAYKRRSHLSTHMRTHTGERPHVCNWGGGCKETFRRSDELARHLLRHTGERNFDCGHCSRRFKRPDHVKAHLGVHARELSLDVDKYEILSSEKMRTYKLLP